MTKTDFYFEGAKMWDAILLNDEADMDRRKGEPGTHKKQSRFRCVRHSAHHRTQLTLIGILRAMEGCQTTLVLITNQIGSSNDTFTSRIQVSLYYPEFKEEERGKLWKIWIDKVRKEWKDIMRVPIETWIARNEGSRSVESERVGS